MMPGLSGYEVCDQLRKVYLPSQLPVVMLTAKNRVVDLVVQVISKVMDKSINDDEHRGLIAKELENVKKQG